MIDFGRFGTHSPQWKCQGGSGLMKPEILYRFVHPGAVLSVYSGLIGNKGKDQQELIPFLNFTSPYCRIPSEIEIESNPNGNGNGIGNGSCFTFKLDCKIWS